MRTIIMKFASTLLNAVLAVSIAVTPLHAAADPKSKAEEEKRAAVAKARQSAGVPQQAVQRPVAKAPSQPRPVARPTPQRPPSVKQSSPQRSVSKAPDRPKAIARPAPQRPPTVKQSAPQRAVAKAPPKAAERPNREAIVRSAPQPSARKSPSIAQPRRVSPPERNLERATVDRPTREATPTARGQSERLTEDRRAQARAQENARERAAVNEREKPRSIARSPESRPPQAKREAPMTAAAARAAAAERGGLRSDRDDRLNRDGRGAESPALSKIPRQPGRDLVQDREERRGANQDSRRPQDLTTTTRERERDGDRRSDVTHVPRTRDNVDRRPPPVDTAEARQLRAERAEIRERVGKDRPRQISQRLERNRDRVQSFRENRRNRYAAVDDRRQILRTSIQTQYNPQIVIDNRQEIRNYWGDRGEDIRFRVEDRRDYLFNDSWWDRCHWRDRHVHVSNPWWWWLPARWGAVNVFLDAGWDEPIVYDYGTDVIYNERVVYVRGEPVGTPLEYSRQVIELANPSLEVIAEAPVVETEWTPLGVWALVQENQGDAVMFFQLSVNKTGMISGAYANVVSGENLPVVGQVDRKTQRAAWHIGEQTDKVFEAGMSNLTEDQASCLVHLAPGEMQPWLLVRMAGPDLPNLPANVGEPGPSAAVNP